MKVVHLSTSDLGGAGLATGRLHMALLEAGIDSHLLTLYKFKNGMPAHIRYQSADGASFPLLEKGLDNIRKALKYSGILPSKHVRIAKHHLRNRPDGFENFSFSVSPYALQNHPLLRDADIVHLNWVSEGFLDFNSFFRKINKNVVWTLHDMNPFTGGCHHADGCGKFMDNCMPCPQLKNTVDECFAGKMLEQKMHSMKGMDSQKVRIVTPSQWLGSLSQKSKLFNRFKHAVIPNGIDPGNFPLISRGDARKSLGLPLDKKIVLFISHHIDNKRKGLHLLLDAIKDINRSDILVCSAGNELSEGENSGIKHLGYITNSEEMSKIYSAADLFVLPSQAENFPNTICEALFCGTPVVAFEVGGIPELINPKNGKLAILGESKSLALSINTVLNHPENYNRTTIREAAVSFMSSPVVAKKYIEIYNQFK